MTGSPEGAAPLPRLHLVTDDAVLAEPGFTERAVAIAREFDGRVAIHVRGPRSSGALVWRTAAALTSAAGSTAPQVFVNDRLDVALASRAAGVQLGTGSFPVPVARRLVGAERAIGVSVHEPHEAREAADEGADFVLAGNLYRTGSHPARPPRGLDWLRQVCAEGVPVIAIGGLRPDHVAEVVQTGAWGVAVLSAVWSAARPPHVVAEFLEELAHAVDRSDSHPAQR